MSGEADPGARSHIPTILTPLRPLPRPPYRAPQTYKTKTRQNLPQTSPSGEEAPTHSS